MRGRQACFTLSALAGGWVLAGYPLSLQLLPSRNWRQDEALSPLVTIIVPAFRERESLRRKLEALRTLDYPADRLQVIVTIDEDRELADIARAAYPGAVVSFAEERDGKAKALNRGLAEASGEIVIMTDANNILAPGSVRAAVRHFADDQIWAVAGRRGEIGSAYDRYEDLIRRLESRTGTVAAMNGEFMAIRRSRVPSWPTHVVNDDLWLLCQIVRQGGRVVYEPEAVSLEDALPAADEVRRRSRMGAGRVMLAGELADMPSGFRWRLISHKFGRLALPFLMLSALVSSLSLGRRRPYGALAGAQLGVYALGALSATGVDLPGPTGVAGRAARQLLLGNWAVAVGVVRGLRGRQSTKWDPVASVD